MDIQTVIFAVLVLTLGDTSVIGGIAGPMSLDDRSHCMGQAEKFQTLHDAAVDEGKVGFVRGQPITKDTYRFGCVELPAGSPMLPLGSPLPEGIVYPE